MNYTIELHKQERRNFLFWFHNSGLPLTHKESAWAGWINALEHKGLAVVSARSLYTCKVS